MSSASPESEPNVLFVYGMSATGKTYFGKYLKRERDWIFIEVDMSSPGNGDGIDASGLRAQWNHFLSTSDATPLLAELSSRAKRAKSPGVVMCFPSRRELENRHVSAIKDKIALVYFIGKEEYCLREFRDREENLQRTLDPDHWQKKQSGYRCSVGRPRTKEIPDRCLQRRWFEDPNRLSVARG